MKHILIYALLISLALWGITMPVRAQGNVGINDNISTPKSSAMLDVFSATKGLLIPRLALSSTTLPDPVTSPEVSLLVYNTATTADVKPGYYYWDASAKWARLVAGTDPSSNNGIFEKTVSDTLLKTETMVLASGNITLTLPSVTSADNGLEITIKNVGIPTDLITVVPTSGSVIDSRDKESLIRWQNHTFVAAGSNWLLKDKTSHTENLFDVSPASNFTTIAEVIGFLNMHMSGASVIRLGGGTHVVDSTILIDLPYPVTIQGVSFGGTSIDASSNCSGEPMFMCETECYFKLLTFNAFSNLSGNDALHFTGSEEYYEVKDAYLVGFNKGIVSTTNNDLWIFEIDFDDCASAGIEIAAGVTSGGRLRVSEIDFHNCAKGINLESGLSVTISIINCSFYNTISGSDVGVAYNPSTFTSLSSMFITNNAWNNQGEFYSGFDFSRTDGRDANVFLINNSGIENKNPHGKINVNDNTSTTTVTISNTWYRANWTNSSSYTCKLKIENNKITYLSDYQLDGWAIITGNLSLNSNNKVITVAIIRNGDTSIRYGETNLRITTANQPFQFSTAVYIPKLKKSDYLELFVTSSTEGVITSFQDVQWFLNTL